MATPRLMACAKDGHADVAALLLDGVSTDFVGDNGSWLVPHPALLAAGGQARGAAPPSAAAAAFATM